MKSGELREVQTNPKGHEKLVSSAREDEEKSYCEYLEKYPSAKRNDEQIAARIRQFRERYMKHLDYTVYELGIKLKELEDIVKKRRKTQRKRAR